MTDLQPSDLTIRARKLRLLLFDVDGVLTDGRIRVHADGTESKQFHIKDGAAIVWAGRAGLVTGVLSGRTSRATEQRAAELGMRIIAQGAADKRAAFDSILRTNGWTGDEVGFMGDDLMDLPVLARAGVSAAPADAAEEVRSRVHWTSRLPGGHGAAREFIEFMLKARGEWDRVVRGYLE